MSGHCLLQEIPTGLGQRQQSAFCFGRHNTQNILLRFIHHNVQYSSFNVQTPVPRNAPNPRRCNADQLLRSDRISVCYTVLHESIRRSSWLWQSQTSRHKALTQQRIKHEDEHFAPTSPITTPSKKHQKNGINQPPW